MDTFIKVREVVPASDSDGFVAANQEVLLNTKSILKISLAGMRARLNDEDVDVLDIGVNVVGSTIFTKYVLSGQTMANIEFASLIKDLIPTK